MEVKPKKKKATRKQREARRALNAQIYNEGFQKGWELCEQMHENKMQRLCRQNCGVTE